MEPSAPTSELVYTDSVVMAAWRLQPICRAWKVWQLTNWETCTYRLSFEFAGCRPPALSRPLQAVAARDQAGMGNWRLTRHSVYRQVLPWIAGGVCTSRTRKSSASERKLQTAALKQI